MNGILELWQLALPLLLAVGGVAAWQVSKRDRTREDTASKWRDDSLDDWRKERDAAAEERRVQRAEGPEEVTGRAEEQQSEKRHQRIGG